MRCKGGNNSNKMGVLLIGEFGDLEIGVCVGCIPFKNFLCNLLGDNQVTGWIGMTLIRFILGTKLTLSFENWPSLSHSCPPRLGYCNLHESAFFCDSPEPTISPVWGCWRCHANLYNVDLYRLRGIPVCFGALFQIQWLPWHLTGTSPETSWNCFHTISLPDP